MHTHTQPHTCTPHTPGDSGDSIYKLGLEEYVGIIEHAIFQRHDYELGAVEVSPQHLTYVL